VGGRDATTNQPLVSALTQVLEQVDILKAQGINKIILMDHAQDFTGDPLSAQDLRDIDVIVSAGSTGFLAQESPIGPFNLLRDGDESSAGYPTLLTDMDRNPVIVVNSEQQYRSLGNLIIGFDTAGLLNFIDVRSGPIAATQKAVDALGAEVGIVPLMPSAEVADIWSTLQNTPLIQSQFEIIGTTGKALNGLRADVRSRETNLGRVVADSTIWGAQRFLDDSIINWDVDIALKNGGGIRDTILGPNITRLTIGAALAFDNRLAIVEIKAGELLAAIENAVSRFPATDGRFPQVAGMHLMFDPTKPGMSDQTSLMTPSRIESLIVTRADGSQDLVVENFILRGDATRTFGLATNNFLATGGDGYAALGAVSDDPAREICETTVGEQQILAEYLVGQLGGEVDIPDPTTTPRVDACISKALGGYLGWANQFFTNGAAGTGIAQDFNNDGTSNLVAYAFQMDPTGAAVSRNLPTASMDGDDLILTLTIVNDSAIGVIIESSINLSDWSEMIIDSDYTIDADVENTGNGTRSLTLRIPGVIATQETIFTRAKIVTND